MLKATPVKSHSVLTPSGFLYAFTHTLNPYMGCAFGDNGCGVYCYVAESPLGRHAPQPWGQWLKAKVNAAAALEKDLAQMPVGAVLKVFMSSATDPYQPEESRLGVTRDVLEVFRLRPPDLLVVQTRSPLVERDFDLLTDIPSAWISMTVETDDDAVRRKLTPTCPGIERRFSVMQRARQAGIKVQGAVSPTLPHNLHRFADLLAESSDRVIVDTFAGDGANGMRTAHRPLPKRFTDAGYGNWRDQSAARRLFEAVSSRMGRDKVGWSQQGFNALAEARPLVGAVSN